MSDDVGMLQYYGDIEHKIFTKGNLKTNKIIWTIPDFINKLSNKIVKEIRAPKTKLKQPDECKFQLMMKFLGVENRWIEIYYSTSDPDDVLNSVEVKMFGSIEDWSGSGDQDRDEQDYRVVYKVLRQLIEANKWQYLTHLSDVYINIEDNYYNCYFDDCNVLLLMRDGSLRLTFDFVVTIKDDKKDPSVSIDSLAPTQPQSSATQMITDFEKLLNDSLYSDFLMKSADSEEFRVHKGILASRSPVLKAHFETNPETTNIVDSPFESAVLSEVLSFIYTDKTPKIDEFPEKLLAAADYYQLSELKSRCEETLRKKLTVNNAIETLQLAEAYKAKTLKERILDFIKYDGQFRQIVKTDGWNKLQSVDIIKEICDYCN